MKKFLVILMVVVMASFLLVGCLPTTNVGPVFTSTAGTTATVGTVYSYTPTATDADDDTVTFAVAGPTGMAISAGIITWTPTTAQIGTETVVVTASDGTNATAQTFTITVSAAGAVPAAVAAVAAAAIVLDLAVWTTAADISTFLNALANAAFTGYTAANDAAYVAAAVASSFSAVTTVTAVNTAVTTVNTAQTAIVTAAAVAAVNAATTAAALNTALANAAFTGYVAANYDAYFVNIGFFTAVLTPTVTAVNGAMAVVALREVSVVAATPTSAALNTALADAAFTGYVAANYAAYFANIVSFNVNTVLAVDTAIAAVSAVVAVNTATTGAALNAALTNAAFAGYVAENSVAYTARIALFSTTLTPTVATINTAIGVANTAVVAAIAAVNAATTEAGLNAALANAAFTDYLAANSAAYFTSAAPNMITTVYTTVAGVNTDIALVNTAAAAAALVAPTVAWTTTGNTDGAIAAAETLVLTFSKAMVPLAITALNIDTILLPTAGKTHRDGAGAIGNAIWLGGNTVLRITYTAGTAIPTIAATDTITAVGFTSAVGGVALTTVNPFTVGAGNF